MSSHYIQGLDWNEKVIHQANKLLDKLYTLKNDLKDVDTSELSKNDSMDIITSLCDDLNTPAIITQLNKLIKVSNHVDHDRKTIKAQMNLISKALGILQDDSYKQISNELEQKIKTLIEERLQAKNNKDYELADKIRSELLNLGIEIKDTNVGTKWNLKS